jgi:hypothetical protein
MVALPRSSRRSEAHPLQVLCLRGGDKLRGHQPNVSLPPLRFTLACGPFRAGTLRRPKCLRGLRPLAPAGGRAEPELARVVGRRSAASHCWAATRLGD